MLKQIRTALLMLVMLTVLTGVIYPLFITLVGQVVFPSQVNGSLVMANDAVVGSALIGQMNDDPRYFWGRPSATGYSALPSSGSNLSPTSATLQAAAVEREAAFRAANHVPENVAVPTEMLFASASGLDPHISPEAARLQIDRVANERSLNREQVATLVEQYVEQPQLGFLGQERVNVLLLNLALDGLQ